MTDETLAQWLHEEMNFRIGIPDLHPGTAAVDEPTCELLAAHLAARRSSYLDVGSTEFRAAVVTVFEAPGEWGPAQGYYGEYIDRFIAALRAALEEKP